MRDCNPGPQATEHADHWDTWQSAVQCAGSAGSGPPHMADVPVSVNDDHSMNVSLPATPMSFHCMATATASEAAATDANTIVTSHVIVGRRRPNCGLFFISSLCYLSRCKLRGGQAKFPPVV